MVCWSYSGDVSDRQVFRSAGAVVLWWAWLVFAVASLVALAVSGRGHSSAVTAFLVVAVTGVVYGCAWWPRIVADESGICVLNPLRGHTVPWPAVTNVDLVNAVRVHAAPAPGAARGPVIYSWAVQSSARARLKSEAGARRSPRSRPAWQSAGRPAAYAKLPPEAQEAMERSASELVAQQLNERVARERERRERTAAVPAAVPATGRPGTGGVRVSWAWAPIGAMVLPVLALIIAVLA
jgi:Bacterial PH domain